MDKVVKKREYEKRLLKVMIDIYQRHHKDETIMCHELYDYACIRIDKCPFMETKTFCSACQIHCYQEKYQKQIKNVMRYSGKWMLLYHPFLTIKHGYITVKGKIKKDV